MGASCNSANDGTKLRLVKVGAPAFETCGGCLARRTRTPSLMGYLSTRHVSPSTEAAAQSAGSCIQRNAGLQRLGRNCRSVKITFAHDAHEAERLSRTSLTVLLSVW
jgi:hypothetical protein